MKAEGTVMKLPQIKKLYEGQPDDIHEGMDLIIAQAQAEISFKAGVREAIKVYTPYVKALEEENGSLIGLAYSHGWRSSQVEFGKQCRVKIKELKAKGKLNSRIGI